MKKVESNLYSIKSEFDNLITPKLLSDIEKFHQKVTRLSDEDLDLRFTI